MKLYGTKRRNGGATLVEVSIAIAVLAVMGGALIAAFNYGFCVLQLTRENQRATQILLEKVETIRLYRWDQVNSNGFIPASFQDVYDPQAASGHRGVVYQMAIQVTNVSGDLASLSYASNLAEVRILLTWTNSTGRLLRSRYVSTLVARDGLQNYVY